MKLLIVVDKLLTGFDAPPATYLYIDKQMQDHGLFQAICRVNRLDGDDKEYGYIIDYKDLFKSLERRGRTTTPRARSTATTRRTWRGCWRTGWSKARERPGGGARGGQGAVRAGRAAEGHGGLPALLLRRRTRGNAEQLKDNEPKRAGALQARRGARCAPTPTSPTRWPRPATRDAEAAAIKAEVDHYEKVRDEVKLASGDYIDLKMYEPAMRHLIDTYIRAEESEKVSAFDDLSLVQLIVERGADAVDALPEGIREEQGSRGRDHREQRPQADHRRAPINPKYYEKMSEAARRADRAAAQGRARATRSIWRRSSS